MKQPFYLILLLFCLFIGTGCMHVISAEGRAATDDEVRFSEVYHDPQNFLGKRLLIGGLMLGVTEDENTTTLEVLAYTLSRTGEPIDIDESGERFLVRTAEKLDTEKYQSGLLVTLTGTVGGSETIALTGRDYTYPLLLLHEIHLWDEPFRRGLIPGQDINAPFHERPPQIEGHENPYDPGYAPYPYTPYYYR